MLEDSSFHCHDDELYTTKFLWAQGDLFKSIALTIQHSLEHLNSINKHLKKRKEANSLTLEAESDKFFCFENDCSDKSVAKIDAD